MTEIVGGYFDYDASDIHARYAEGRRISPRVMTMWLEAIGRHIPCAEVKTIVDLGCGTGRFTAALGRHFSAQVIGIDPSRNMLGAAADPVEGSAYVQARAGKIPLRDGCADLVFASMVWHHFSDKRETAAEIARVLRTGGYLCIRTATRDALDFELYLRFFPSARSLNEQIMPARHDLISCLTGCGLALTHHRVVRHPQNRNPQEYAARVALRAFSDLASIPDREFRLGMEALRRHCAAAPQDQEIAVDVDLFVFRAAQ
jgi:ubiquinone/menaquinone biosynthesis C-methylase UbiE